MDWHHLNLIRIIVLLTLVHACFGKLPKANRNRYLLALLLVCFATELLTVFLEIYNLFNGMYITISMIVHNMLWLLIVLEGFRKTKYIPVVLGVFLSWAAINMVFFEGIGFNYLTFVVGAFLYTFIFIYQSFEKLNSEELRFFTSNNYLLMCAPILFFLGLSFMFGFGSRLITSSPVFKSFDLYDCIIHFVNIIYYVLINAYLFREKKETYAR